MCPPGKTCAEAKKVECWTRRRSSISLRADITRTLQRVWVIYFGRLDSSTEKYYLALGLGTGKASSPLAGLFSGLAFALLVVIVRTWSGTSVLSCLCLYPKLISSAEFRWQQCSFMSKSPRKPLYCSIHAWERLRHSTLDLCTRKIGAAIHGHRKYINSRKCFARKEAEVEERVLATDPDSIDWLGAQAWG